MNLNIWLIQNHDNPLYAHWSDRYILDLRSFQIELFSEYSAHVIQIHYIAISVTIKNDDRHFHAIVTHLL